MRVLGKDIRSYDRHALRGELLGRAAGRVPLRGHGAVERRDGGPDHRTAPGPSGRSRSIGRAGALPAPRGGARRCRWTSGASNFSAGERQLIAFARAVYREAPVLILDEATASVDSDTEARLQRALEAVMEGRTALMIAHRLSTIRAADRIVVFHKGRMVETGTHDELMAKGPSTRASIACSSRARATEYRARYCTPPRRPRPTRCSCDCPDRRHPALRRRASAVRSTGSRSSTGAPRSPRGSPRG